MDNHENTNDLNQTRSQRRAAVRSETEMREAVREINAMAAQFSIPNHKVSSFIDERGFDVEGFRALVMNSIRDGGTLRPSEEPELGMSRKEIQQYSFVRAIRAQMDPLFKRDAGLEVEVSRAFAQKTGREPQGIFVPPDVLQHRDLVVGTPTAGGNLVATELYKEGFIGYLYKRCYLMALGARQLTQLVGNLTIPSQTGKSTAYWVAENSSVTESQPAFGQVAMAPKTVGGYTDYSRKMMLQSSPEIENLVRADLAQTIAVELDRVAIVGSGSGAEPRGILNTSGVGAIAIGANGGAPTWAHMLQLEETISLGNADTGNLGLMTNPKVRRKLKETTKVSADAGAGFIWESGPADDPGWGKVNGYRAVASNNVPSDLDKGTSTGVCSAAIFGNWADLLIGMWGGLDLIVDPYTGAPAGTQRIVALMDVDIAIRRAASFVVVKDILTT